VYAAKIGKLRFQAPHQLAFLGDPIVLFESTANCMLLFAVVCGRHSFDNALRDVAFGSLAPLSPRRRDVRWGNIGRTAQCCSGRHGRHSLSSFGFGQLDYGGALMSHARISSFG
jgi:hypothetical protein